MLWVIRRVRRIRTLPTPCNAQYFRIDPVILAQTFENPYGTCLARTDGMVLVDAGGITQLNRRIIGAAMRVHTAFGPGLFEPPYRLGLAIELARADLRCEVEKVLPVKYGDVSLGIGYRMDIVVEDRVVLEIKSVQQILPVHRQQLLTYLRIGGYPAGLILNFGVLRLKDGGISRVLNDIRPGRLRPPEDNDPGRVDEH